MTLTPEAAHNTTHTPKVIGEVEQEQLEERSAKFKGKLIEAYEEDSSHTFRDDVCLPVQHTHQTPRADDASSRKWQQLQTGHTSRPWRELAYFGCHTIRMFLHVKSATEQENAYKQKGKNCSGGTPKTG